MGLAYGLVLTNASDASAFFSSLDSKRVGMTEMDGIVNETLDDVLNTISEDPNRHFIQSESTQGNDAFEKPLQSPHQQP